ncbi:MAG: hypothetical protein C0403_08795 [Desulfobacterium sp.]|nr:hypothetical protein [Desulfobacterium sp.]
MSKKHTNANHPEQEQAAAKGDVRFFELAYLEAEIHKPDVHISLKKKGELSVQVTFKDFVIPNTELIPDEVRSKVKKWSDSFDYWAVDWDFRNDSSQAFDAEVK